MEKLLLNLNDRVEIKYECKTYRSTIQDITEDTFSINIPQSNGDYLILHNTDLVEIMTYNSKEEFPKIYKFKEKVIGKKIEENGMRLYSIKKPKEAEFVQRRKYVREDLIHLIKYAKGDYEIDAFKSLNKENGIILDISAGGVKLKTRENLKLGEKLILGMNFEKFKDIQREIIAKGNVIRVENMDNKEFAYGIQFEDIDKKDKEDIMKLVFSIIRKHRKQL